MTRRLWLTFVVGIMCGMFALGAGALALQVWGDEARAGDQNTWQIYQISENEGPEPWVNSLPADCNLVPDLNYGVIFYSCPD